MKNQITVTKIIYSMDKWWLQLNNLQELEIPENRANELIDYYGMTEVNFQRWELI